MPSFAVVGTRHLIVVVAAVAIPLLAACNGTLAAPGDMTTSQAVIDIGNMVVQLREENAQLQAQIDSLRAVAAYQGADMPGGCIGRPAAPASWRTTVS